LIENGHYPASSLEVTGSPRLDALAAEAAGLTADAIASARSAAGAAGKHLVVVTTKQREAERALAPLLDAAGAMPDVQVAIKAHPAETPEVYGGAIAGRRNVSVLDAAAPLAPLLLACRAVVTVNSTVALDAAVLGVPALVIGLPNNLSPFVRAGVLAGTEGETADDARRALERILYDEEFRQALDASRRTFLARFNIAADGRASERSAQAILRLARERSSSSGAT
jgi:UDP-N-acetylglucosamine 2-epimerase